jgi:glycyl-tRNA synthetase
MARREELGHPLGLVPPTPLPVAPKPDPASLPTAARDFVLELGTEELPPEDVDSALEQLRWLEGAFLAWRCF